MRKHAKSWLIKVALFAIVIVFIFWGGYSYTARRASRVAEVNGSYIDIQEYRRAYNDLVEQMRRQLGKQFSNDMVQTLKVKEQALDRLINRRLLLAEAKRLDLTISSKELQDAILSYPAFQSYGRFDQQRYLYALRSMQLTPQEFEAKQREDMLIDKVGQLVGRNAKVLDSEVLSFYHHAHDKVNLAYVEINPQRFTDQVKPDKDALTRYFDEHRESYRLPAKRRIVYVRFEPQDYVHEVQKPDDTEIGDYYYEHQDKYRLPEKVRARQIFFRASQGASDAEIQTIKDRAGKVLALARKGADFAALARKYSEDPSAARGGDLGYFTRSEVVPSFAQAAFSLKKGEISGLVRTRFGFHIIEVEDIRKAVTRPLAEVRDEVIKSLKLEQAGDIARERAESFSDAARAAEDLRKAAIARGLQVRDSGLFSADEAIPGLGRHPDVSDAIFALQLREISSALSLDQDQVVAQLTEIQDSRLPEFKEVADQVRQDWITARSKEVARQKATTWLATALQEKNLAGIAHGHGLTLRETGFFTSLAPAAALENNRDLLTTAFALTPEHPVAPEPYEVGSGFLLIQLKAREPASETELQKEKKVLAQRLLQVKEEMVLRRWLTALRQQSDIKILQKL